METASRATKSITTESGKEVVFKTYLTGRENNELKTSLLSGVTVDAEKNMSSMPLTNGLARESKLIELAIVSFDNSTENIVQRVGDLPSTEYDALLKTLDSELKLSFQQTK